MIDQQPYCDDLCDDHQLLRMLRSDSDSCDSGEMLDHVEQCQRCQHRLDELAANESEWRKTVEVLSSNARDAATDGQDRFKPSFHKSRVQLRQQAWTDAMAKSLLSAPSHPEMLGRIGRYDVERVIGSGGMGVVFKAYDTELNRPVAVKLLAPYLAGNGAARKRFAREARAAAAVVDEHVVPIYNVESDGEHPFLVMKYIAGGSLQQRLDREGPLEVCEVLRIGMQTAKGLAAAHAQGLIHRDVKPSNILLDEGVERALLTDFGLARAEDDACLTRSGFHPGTPHYMSPEQVRGEAIDARSDLFGLGCVLYSLCTGHPPFRTETSYAVLRRITDTEPRPIRETNPDVPPWLEQIVTKLLAKSADDRFESAAEVAELLEDCLAHVQQPTTTPVPESVAAMTPKQNGRPPIGKFIAAAAFAFSLIFAGVLIVLELDKGTLTIESEADDVPIRIMQGEDVVGRLTVSKSGTSTRLAAGNYVVEVDGDFKGIDVGGGVVSLRRGGDEIVRIVKALDDVGAEMGESGGSIIDAEGALHVPLNMPYYGAGGYDTEDVTDALDKLLKEKQSKQSANLPEQTVLSVVTKMERLLGEGKHHEWLEMVEDGEVQRFAGLALIGRAQQKASLAMLGELVDRIAASDEDIANMQSAVARTDPMFRTNPPADATAAFNLLTAIATMQMGSQLGSAPEGADDFRSQVQGIDSFSQLLRTASGVSANPRDFVAAAFHNSKSPMLRSNNGVFPAANWSISVNGNQAIATDLNKADHYEPLNIQLRLSKGGTWKISKLIRDEDFQAMMMVLIEMTSEQQEDDNAPDDRAEAPVLSTTDQVSDTRSRRPSSEVNINWDVDLELSPAEIHAAVSQLTQQIEADKHH